MKYITKDFFQSATDIKTGKPTEWFEKLFKIENFLVEKLGQPYLEEQVNTFIKGDISCPNGCKNPLFYVTNKYFTEDKQKQILSAKCCACNLQFFAYQEISLE